MGAAISGRHTVTGVTTTLTRRHTVALITGVMVIIIQRLTMTLLRELTAGNRLLMAHMVRRRGGLVTIPTRALTREAPVFRRRMAAEARRRPITRIPEPMLRPDKVRALMRNGAALMCQGETRVLPWVITQLRTAP